MAYKRLDKTSEVVSQQIAAMGSKIFEVGLFRPDASDGDGRSCDDSLGHGMSESLIRSIPWMRLQNLQGRNVYVRPHGEHDLTMVDDLKRDSIDRMVSTGFKPAVLVETSPGNFQAWLKHSRAAEARNSVLQLHARWPTSSAQTRELPIGVTSAEWPGLQIGSSSIKTPTGSSRSCVYMRLVVQSTLSLTGLLKASKPNLLARENARPSYACFIPIRPEADFGPLRTFARIRRTAAMARGLIWPTQFMRYHTARQANR